MKKLLTLVLALALALALAVPAMAFTSATEDPESPFELDIYLVEYDSDDIFGGITGFPPSDRGYAKNEIVAAIVEFVVPKNEDLADFASLVLSGDDVSLNVADNEIVAGEATLNTSKGELAFDYADNELSYDALATFDGDDKAHTGKVLFFAKVTGDDASLTATLDSTEVAWTSGVLDVGDYLVEDVAAVDPAPHYFLISEDGGADLFKITLTSKDKTEDLYIFDGLEEYLAVNPETGLFYDDAGVRVTDKAIIRGLQAIYEDVFVDVFGFDFSISGGLLKKGFFEDMNGSDDIEATVEIKPWTAYVTVPDNIVVDPPKTGDAASIVGFVMIVLAAAAVVAVKKVRA